MRIVDRFDPATEISTTFKAGFSNGQGRIIVFNQSPQNLDISWDSYTTYCPAWTAMLYCISSSNVNLNWVIQSSLDSSAPPISQVTILALDANEPAPGTFPYAINHQLSLGNSVPLSTSATSIANDGNAISTPILESTVSGDASSCVRMSNDGVFAIGTAAHPGSVSFDDGLIFSDGSGGFSLARWLYANLIIALSGNDLTLSVATGHKIALQVNGSDVADFTGNGVTFQQNIKMNNGSVEFFEGAIARESSFTGAASGFYNHGMSAAPNWIGPMCNVSGSQAMGFDSVGSTTCHITSSSGLGFTAQCFR